MIVFLECPLRPKNSVPTEFSRRYKIYGIAVKSQGN